MNNIYVEKKDSEGTTYEFRIFIRNWKLIVSDVGVKPKRKRKFTYMVANLTQTYEYRRLSPDERSQYEKDYIVQRVGVELMNDALEEAWMRLRPDKLTLKED